MVNFFREQTRPIAALITTAAVGASMGVFARILSRDFSNIQQIALRCTIGCVLFYVFAHRKVSFAAIIAGGGRELAISVGRAFSIYVVAITLGTIAFIHGNYGAVSVVMAMPLTALLSAIIFRERVDTAQAAFVIVSFIGAVLVISQSHPDRFVFDWPLLVAFCAAAFMAFGVLARKWQSPDISAYTVTFVMLFAASAIMIIASIVESILGDAPFNISIQTLLVGICAGLANVIFLMTANYAIPRLSGISANNILALQPVFGVLIGVSIYDESLGSGQIFGAVLIGAAIVGTAYWQYRV